MLSLDSFLTWFEKSSWRARFLTFRSTNSRTESCWIVELVSFLMILVKWSVLINVISFSLVMCNHSECLQMIMLIMLTKQRFYNIEIEITTDLICLYDYSKVDFSQTFFSDSLQNDLSFDNSMIIEHEHSILVSDTNDRKWLSLCLWRDHVHLTWSSEKKKLSIFSIIFIHEIWIMSLKAIYFEDTASYLASNTSMKKTNESKINLRSK